MKAFMIAALLVTACATDRAATARRAKTEMIGLSKAELLACAGAPARQASAGEIEVFTYSGGGDSVTTAWSTSYNSAVGKTAKRYCEASFVIENDVVTKVNYSGRTGGWATKGEQCAFIVENCLR